MSLALRSLTRKVKMLIVKSVTLLRNALLARL